MKTDRETFSNAVQSALSDLYNPTALRGNVLAVLFAVDQRDPIATVRNLLTNAIQKLKPGVSVPSHTNAWRVYHILTYRYVEQLTQKEVAAELMLSVRQLRRLEHAAVDVLTEALWELYRSKTGVTIDVQTPPNQVASGSKVPDHEDELAWLKSSMPSEITELEPLVTSILKTLNPMASLKDIAVELDLPPDLPSVYGPSATIRQTVLSLLSTAMQAVPQSILHIQGKYVPPAVTLHIISSGGQQIGELSEETRDSMDMICSLCELFDGQLNVTSDSTSQVNMSVTLTIPAVGQTPVLVIDDNADALHLIERFLESTRYIFYGTQDPGQVLLLAEETQPRVIILDVMLPDVDGWELLGRIRAHPQLHDVSVIVCTILPQAQLALTLGADAFLRKPIDQDELLATLGRLLD